MIYPFKCCYLSYDCAPQNNHFSIQLVSSENGHSGRAPPDLFASVNDVELLSISQFQSPNCDHLTFHLNLNLNLTQANPPTHHTRNRNNSAHTCMSTQ